MCRIWREHNLVWCLKLRNYLKIILKLVVKKEQRYTFIQQIEFLKSCLTPDYRKYVGCVSDGNIVLFYKFCLKSSNQHETVCTNRDKDKGSHPVKKSAVFFNIVQKAFEPTSPLPLKIWYNVPILPSNFTINASKVPFHANFMLLNYPQNKPNLQHNFWTWVWSRQPENALKNSVG